MPFGKIVLGLMLVSLIVGAHHPAWSQQFPYAAPQAPEFDDRGNLRGSGRSDTEPPQPVITPSTRKRERAYTQPQPQPQPQYGVVTPYAPEIGVPSAPVPPSQPAPPPQQRPAPVHRASPQSPPRQAYQPPPQQRPDCSQYPMLIARARSEPEMQMTARQYLTCLLKSGWGMEQARAHVISTIESTYRLTRQLPDFAGTGGRSEQHRSL